MQRPHSPGYKPIANRRGFAMPVVLFALVILSTMAIVLLDVSEDEGRASKAVRLSAEAFYAAETGLSAVQSKWYDSTSSFDSLVGALSTGGTLDLGWDTLPSGSSYHAQVMLVASDPEPMYLVTVDGKAPGTVSTKTLTLLLTGTSNELTLGGCCRAAALVRGEVELNDRTFVSGTDQRPPQWSGNVCDGIPSGNKPGIITDEPGNLRNRDDSFFESSGDTVFGPPYPNQEPAVVIDTTVSDSTFDNYGSATWQDVKDMHTAVLGNPADLNKQLKIYYGGDPVPPGNDTDFGPRYHALGDGHGHVSGDAILGSCDTTHPLNYGAPTGPCANHFPVVLVQGEVEFFPDNFYLQGIFILDSQGAIGSEFELEAAGTMAGIIIGRGCLEIQTGAQFYGAMFVDGDYYNTTLCDGDEPLRTDTDGTRIQYSSCVVQRALAASGLGQLSVASAGGMVRKIDTRALTEPMR